MYGKNSLCHDLRQEPETAEVLVLGTVAVRLDSTCRSVEFAVTCSVTVHLMPRAKAHPA